MSRRPKVLILGRSDEAVETLRNLIRSVPDLETESSVIDADHGDPLRDVLSRPDVLVLRVNGSSTQELQALERYSPDERPPIVVVGDAVDPDAMRVAMRVGARDFLTYPSAGDDLVATIRKIAGEQRASQRSSSGQMLAFVNAKGGSGATFLACNVAHLSCCVSELSTALVDLDLQFGTLPQYLDFNPRRSLLEALDLADELDEVAIDGYLTRLDSGLSVLAGSRETALLQQELMTERFETILNLLQKRFDRVVVDVPRQIEPFSAIVLERADIVVLVMQQSIPSLRDATTMYEILTRNLAVPSDHIRIVVNRYQKNASVELADIKQALHDRKLSCIPSDYRTATQSIDMGVPLYENFRRQAITKAIMSLERELGGNAAPEARRLLPKILRAG
jgi:pilus assembly protein CpaE